MSIDQTIFSEVLLGATAAPAMATAPVHTANNETGFVEHGPDCRRVNGQWQRTDTWNRLGSPAPERRASRHGEVSADGNYSYVGGEQGWALRTPAYRWENGRFLHADALRHDTAKPRLNMTEEEKRRRAELYTGSAAT